MSKHTATIRWQSDGGDFLGQKFSRAHQWEFDGGIVVPGSPTPEVVPAPMSTENAVDPEEAFVASLASCHMLWFLGLAAKNKVVVTSYVDSAWGIMEKNADGNIAITEVTLVPRCEFAGSEPDKETIAQLHEQAHKRCYIANSVKTVIHMDLG